MSAGPRNPDGSPNRDFELPESLQWIRDPDAKIIGIVATWIVGGFLTFGETIIAIILEAGAILADAPVTAAESLAAGFGSAGDALLSVVADVNAAIVATAASAGPFAPIVQVAAYAGLLVVTVRLGRWVLDVVDIPGVDISAVVRAATLPIRVARGILSWR